MNLFIVNQNPESNYNDVEGQHYDYPTSIPNGQQIKIGDCLIFNLSSKAAIKKKLGDKRLTGIAQIDTILVYNDGGKEMALASYKWFKKFKTPLSFEEIGGDIRSNRNNAMNKVTLENLPTILLNIIKHTI